MNKLFALSLLACMAYINAAHATDHEPLYTTDTTSFWFTDSSGQPMAAIVYYPFKHADGTSISPNTQFPATIFMQGGNTDAARYTWLRQLAAFGYIIVLPDKYPVSAPQLNGGDGINTNTKLTTVEILQEAIHGLRRTAKRYTSPIRGRFDGQIAVAGHSLGAVISIIAVDEGRCTTDPASAAIAQCPTGYQRDPAIMAMWMVGGSLESPNGPPDPSMINKPEGFPIYMINGTRDGLNTTEEGHTTYNRYNEPKLFFDIEGANHFGWGDYLHPEDNLRAEIWRTIHKQEQQAITVNAARQFLDCYQKLDTAACNNIPTTPVPIR